MSSYDRPTRRVAALMAAVAALGLSGCGFTPVYGTSQNSIGAEAVLSQINIAPVGDRAGQQLRNELIRLLTPYGEPAEAYYLMTLRITISDRNVFVGRDREVERSNLIFTATYRLVDRAAHEARAPGDPDVVVYENTAFAETSFNRFASEFANIRARRDAENLAAREVAKIIQTQLAAAAATGQV